jgi:hypothetical protein
MSYWNPITNPNHASNNWLNPNPQNYAAQGQNIYNQNYNALGNQLMAGTGVNTQNQLLTEQLQAQQRQTALQNQLIDVRSASDQRSNQGALAQLQNQLAGIPNEKAWRTKLKSIAEGQYNLAVRSAQGQYNVDVGKANEAFGENLRSLYSGAISRGGGLAQVGVRQSHKDLSAQLGLARKGAKLSLDTQLGGANLDLQTQYANYNHYMQQLDQDARDLGIRSDVLHQGMNDALKIAGLDKTVNLAQLAADQKSNDVQKADNAKQVWQMLQQYVMANPQAVTPTPAQLPSASLGHRVF